MKEEQSEVETRLEYFKSKAHEAGVKLTRQRVEIFREIASRHDHPDAEELYRSLRKRIPGVSIDTVYRTLWILYDLNLIATHGQLRESVRFDPNPNPHHHYICVCCGIIRDVASPEFDDFSLPPASSGYGSVFAVRVELSGLCEGCAQAGKGFLAH
ncbi:MAG TPA: Fur family transcriptional regulator [Terracidiphilus sp.]|nr:Fur family transcriptional regulator [Terracidiphilus sp.]